MFEDRSKDELERLFYGQVLGSGDPVGIATQDVALDSRYEWQAVGGTSKPLYQGLAAPGTAIESPTWKIQKFNYDVGPVGDFVVVFIPTRIGPWSDRASLF